jgi:hypothetical protein
MIGGMIHLYHPCHEGDFLNDGVDVSPRHHLHLNYLFYL